VKQEQPTVLQFQWGFPVLVLVIVRSMGLIIYFYFLKSKKGFMKHKNKNWEVSVKQEQPTVLQFQWGFPVLVLVIVRSMGLIIYFLFFKKVKKGFIITRTRTGKSQWSKNDGFTFWKHWGFPVLVLVLAMVYGMNNLFLFFKKQKRIYETQEYQGT
jgi:hypothetical protein